MKHSPVKASKNLYGFIHFSVHPPIGLPEKHSINIRVDSRAGQNNPTTSRLFAALDQERFETLAYELDQNGKTVKLPASEVELFSLNVFGGPYRNI